MIRILVLYGTTDGHTAKVARVLCDALQTEGAEVDLLNAASRVLLPSPEPYDGVIVAGSLHFGGVQHAVKRWVGRHGVDLARRPNAFVLVCLAVLQEDEEVKRDLERIRQRFFEAADWHPDVVKTVAGAIPYTRYGVLKRWLMRRKAAKSGGGTDTTRDYDYTDWHDVRAFAAKFLTRIPVEKRSAVLTAVP